MRLGTAGLSREAVLAPVARKAWIMIKDVPLGMLGKRFTFFCLNLAQTKTFNSQWQLLEELHRAFVCTVGASRPLSVKEKVLPSRTSFLAIEIMLKWLNDV